MITFDRTVGCIYTLIFDYVRKYIQSDNKYPFGSGA